MTAVRRMPYVLGNRLAVGTALALLTASVAAPAQPAEQGAPMRFRHHFVHRGLPTYKNERGLVVGDYGVTALADLDRDGDLDFDTGRKGDPDWRIYWFEYRGPDDRAKQDLGERTNSDVGGDAIDVDGGSRGEERGERDEALVRPVQNTTATCFTACWTWWKRSASRSRCEPPAESRRHVNGCG